MTEIIALSERPDLGRAFNELPGRLYKYDRCWVPYVTPGDEVMFDRERNPAMQLSTVERWVALRDGQCVGRVAAIISRRWIEKIGENVGRFSRLECVDDQEVCHALLHAAEAWLAEHGMTAVVGPLGFNNLDQQGFTVEGFERLAALGSNLTKPYYPRLIEAEGYQPKQDWVEYRLDVPPEVPRRVEEVAAIAENRHAAKLIDITTVGALRKVAPEIVYLFGTAFEPLFGTYPFTEQMKEFYIEGYIGLLDPNLVVAVREDGSVYSRLIGFIVGMPSVSHALAASKNSWAPLRKLRLWGESHRPREIEILLAAVDPAHRKQGTMGLMIRELLRKCNERGIKHIETTAILCDNEEARDIVEVLPHEQHKRKRCYIKSLPDK